MPEAPKPPELAKLDAIFAPPDAENFSEAVIKYGAPETRRAKETLAAANAAYERLFTLLKLGFSGVLLLVFSCISVYVLFLKPNATEAQRLSASTMLTAIASGSAGYAFGKKQEKSEKE